MPKSKELKKLEEIHKRLCKAINNFAEEEPKAYRNSDAMSDIIKVCNSLLHVVLKGKGL